LPSEVAFTVEKKQKKYNHIVNIQIINIMTDSFFVNNWKSCVTTLKKIVLIL